MYAEKETRNLYLVLTRSSTVLSKIIYLLKGSEYTHAALALDEDLELMFSFSRKRPRNPFIGCFKREQLHEGLYAYQKEIPGAVMRLSVTENQYKAVRKLIAEFERKKDTYGYNYAGLFRNIFGVDMKQEGGLRAGGENTFVCSEFVYYILEQSGVCSWKVNRETVLPQNLLALDGEIIFKGDMKQYRDHKMVEKSLRVVVPVVTAA